MTQVPGGEAGVLALDLHHPGEREIVANEDPGTCYQTGRQGLVVRVSDAYHPAVVVVGMAVFGYFDDTKVACAFMTECVGLGLDLKATTPELAFHFLQQVPVRHRVPGGGRCRCWYAIDLSALDRVGPAVEQEVRVGGLSVGFDFDDIVHGFGFLLVDGFGNAKSRAPVMESRLFRLVGLNWKKDLPGLEKILGSPSPAGESEQERTCKDACDEDDHPQILDDPECHPRETEQREQVEMDGERVFHGFSSCPG